MKEHRVTIIVLSCLFVVFVMVIVAVYNLLTDIDFLNDLGAVDIQ